MISRRNRADHCLNELVDELYDNDDIDEARDQRRLLRLHDTQPYRSA